jgi:hypothetical protein
MFCTRRVPPRACSDKRGQVGGGPCGSVGFDRPVADAVAHFLGASARSARARRTYDRIMSDNP